MNGRMELRPLGNALGMEAVGIDLSRPIDEATYRWIDDAFAANPVLVFRNQNLDAAQLLRFAQHFGSPQEHILKKYRHSDYPTVSYISNVAPDGSIDLVANERATAWHADETYNEKLPRLAMLHAKEVTSEKGGTLFADMRAAYRELPDGLKQKITGRTGTHRWLAGPARSWAFYRVTEEQAKANPERYHPAVLRHPVTGQPVLFVNPSHQTGFIGIEPDEGERLVAEISDFATQDRFTYYHRWLVGDLLIWDELATMHKGAGDAPPLDRRVMLRTIVHPDQQPMAYAA